MQFAYVLRSLLQTSPTDHTITEYHNTGLVSVLVWLPVLVLVLVVVLVLVLVLVSVLVSNLVSWSPGLLVLTLVRLPSPGLDRLAPGAMTHNRENILAANFKSTDVF